MEKSIYEFFNNMSEAEFDERFLELSRRDDFSAVASGVSTASDIEAVKAQLIQAGVDEKWLDDESFNRAVHYITTRIFRRKNT